MNIFLIVFSFYRKFEQFCVDKKKQQIENISSFKDI